tara:strand:- start:3468 stop:4925 length:1458 start_codon:yes stop_codon:yes gene_type:complete
MDTFIVNLVNGGNILMDILPSKSTKYEKEDYKIVDGLIDKKMVDKILKDELGDDEKKMVETLRIFYKKPNFSNNLYRNLSHILLKKMHERKNKGGGKRGKRGGVLSKPDMEIIKEMLQERDVIGQLIILMVNAWYLYSCICYFIKVLNIDVGEKIILDSTSIPAVQEDSKALTLTSYVQFSDKAALMSPADLIENENFEPIKVKDLIISWVQGDGELVEDFISSTAQITQDLLTENLRNQLDLSRKSIMHKAYIKYWMRKGVKADELVGLPEDPLSKKLAADWKNYVAKLPYTERTFLFMEQTINPMKELQQAQSVIAEKTQEEIAIQMFKLTQYTKEIVNDAREVVLNAQSKGVTSLSFVVVSIIGMISILVNLFRYYNWLKKKKTDDAEYQRRLEIWRNQQQRFMDRQERFLDNPGDLLQVADNTRSEANTNFLQLPYRRGGRRKLRKKTRKKRRKTRRKSKKRKTKRRKRRKRKTKRRKRRR